MELAGADMTGFYDSNDKALAVSSKAYQTARDAYMVQARANGLSGHSYAALRRPQKHSDEDSAMRVAATKVSFDAVRAAASLHGELLRFAGGADQAGLVAQVEAIAQTVSGLQAGQSQIAGAVLGERSRSHRRFAMERGKRATAALETAGRALSSFANNGK